ncbi:MAG: peptidyl-dipeptidase Dcp, partial [Pseudomonadota bacterium]
MSAAPQGQPLLAAGAAPHGLPPFEAIEPAHFEPALEQAMREHREAVAALGAQAAPPDFDNTCAAFDRSGARLSRI